MWFPRSLSIAREWFHMESFCKLPQHQRWDHQLKRLLASDPILFQLPQPNKHSTTTILTQHSYTYDIYYTCVWILIKRQKAAVKTAVAQSRKQSGMIRVWGPQREGLTLHSPHDGWWKRAQDDQEEGTTLEENREGGLSQMLSLSIKRFQNHPSSTT